MVGVKSTSDCIGKKQLDAFKGFVTTIGASISLAHDLCK